ncbi:pyocin knob domain-containing S74 family peptidase [Aeromonas sp. AE23HZ002T15]
MGFKVQITELSNLPALKNTTAVAISDYSGIGTKTTKVVVVQDTNIGTAAYQAAVQAAIEAKASAAEAAATVANTVKKTGDQAMAGNLMLPRLIASTGIEVQDVNGYGMRQVFSGQTGYLQSGKMDKTTTDQSLMLSGWYGTPLSMLRFSMAQGVNPRVVWGSNNYDILHRGNMPTIDDLGAMGSFTVIPDNDCNKALKAGTYPIIGATINGPSGANSGSTLIVSPFNTVTFNQMVIVRSTGVIWTRTSFNGTFSNWEVQYSSNNKDLTAGWGAGLGTMPDAITTTGGVRDFNLARTSGIYMCQNTWLNGIDNTGSATPVGHTGMLEVRQRTFDNLLTQKYTRIRKDSGATYDGTDELTRTFNGSIWSPWIESGQFGSTNLYRTGVLRLGTATSTASAYTALARQHYKTDTAVGGVYSVGDMNFRVGVGDYDPHTNGSTIASIHGQVVQTDDPTKPNGRLYLQARDLSNADARTTLTMDNAIGIRFSHKSKIVDVVSGQVLADEFLQKTAQSTATNSSTRKDYVDGLVADLEAKKANLSYVNSSLVLKADKTYVDAELLKKSDLTYVNTELGEKADKTYVDAELLKKADKTYTDTELAKKADIAGQVFSGNVRVDRGTSTEPQIGVDRSGRRLFLFDNGTSHGLYSSGLGTGNANTNLITRDTTTGTFSIGGTATEALTITSSNLSLTGNKIELGGVMRVEGYTTGDSRLSSNRYAFMDGPSGSFLSTGEYYNGTAWVKHTATVPSMRLSLENESVMIFSNPANANPNTNSRPAARIYRDGRFGSSNETRRGWAAQGEASFYRERMAVDSGNLIGITSAQYNYPGQWGGEHYTGSYITPNFDETSYVIGYTNDAGASIHWLLKPNGVIQFSRSPGANDWITFVAPRMTVSGDVYANSFQHNSDLRLKSDVKPLDNCLGKLSSIGAYSYIKNGFEGREVGVIAQEVNAVLPDATNTSKGGGLVDAEGNEIENLTVSVTGVATLTAGAVNELHEIVKTQGNLIDTQQQTIDLLMAEIAAIKSKLH